MSIDAEKLIEHKVNAARGSRQTLPAPLMQYYLKYDVKRSSLTVLKTRRTWRRVATMYPQIPYSINRIPRKR